MNPHHITRELEQALCEYTGAPYAVAVNSCTMALLLAVKWQLRDKHWECPTCQRRPQPGQRYECAIQPCGGWRITGKYVEIPKHTYVSVPQSIIHAGGRPTFRDEEWRGAYQLKPLPVWDSARWFSSGMYRSKEEIERAVSSGQALISVKDPVPLHGTPVLSWTGKATIERDCSGQMVCVSFHHSKTLGDTQGGAILHDSPEADVWLRKARFDGRTEGVHPLYDSFDVVGWHCYMSPDVAARLLWKLSSLPKHNDPLPSDDYPDLSQMGIFR